MGKKHATVDYIWNYPYENLYMYHMCVMTEGRRRGIAFNTIWNNPCYRGKVLQYVDTLPNEYMWQSFNYTEFTDTYAQECAELLLDRGDLDLPHNTLTYDERFNELMDILQVDGNFQKVCKWG
jgi:uncharacterized protein (TIGR02328 family)